MEEFLGILECGFKIVKLGFQFYTFGKEITIGEERHWRRWHSYIFYKSAKLVLENVSYNRPYQSLLVWCLTWQSMWEVNGHVSSVNTPINWKDEIDWHFTNSWTKLIFRKIWGRFWLMLANSGTKLMIHSTRCIFFLVAHSIRTPQLSVLDLE